MSKLFIWTNNWRLSRLENNYRSPFYQRKRISQFFVSSVWYFALEDRLRLDYLSVITAFIAVSRSITKRSPSASVTCRRIFDVFRTSGLCRSASRVPRVEAAPGLPHSFFNSVVFPKFHCLLSFSRGESPTIRSLSLSLSPSPPFFSGDEKMESICAN